MSLDQKFAARAHRMKASEIRELLKLLDRPDIISFAGGIPDPNLFPAEAFAHAMAENLDQGRRAQALQYSASEGYLPLREWIRSRMARIGVPCETDNILITSGSQQALDYVGKLFLSQGDTALVGWPTYLGALAAFNAYEPRFDRLCLRANRSPESYERAAAEAGGQVKFAYLSTDFANPTGETATYEERLALLDMAEDLDCAVIEDAAYQSLRYDGEDVPPLLALEIERKGRVDDCRTIYCGSFSKTLSPGLRVGWVVAPREVVAQMVLLKQAADLHSATLNQMAVRDVAAACFDAHVARVRQAYRQRRDAMLNALEAHMPPGVTWSRPEGGMFVWLTLPPGLDGGDLLRRSLDSVKVAFVPGGAFHADGTGRNTLRLSFSNSDESRIGEGIRRLGQLLRDTLPEVGASG